MTVGAEELGREPALTLRLTGALHSLQEAALKPGASSTVTARYSDVISDLGAWKRDKQLLKDALYLNPTSAAIHHKLGNYYSTSKLKKSVYHLELAKHLEPLNVSVLFDLGSLYRKLGDYPKCMHAIASASVLAPTDVRILSCLASLHSSGGDVERAIELGRRVVALDPGFAEGHNNLGIFLRDAGLVREAILEFEACVSLDPGNLHAPHSFLMSLNYLSDMSPEEVASHHYRWGSLTLSQAGRFFTGFNPRSGAFKIGYLSPDFRGHSVSYFVESLLRFHDRREFQVICFHDSRENDDAKTDRLRGLAADWRVTGGLSELELLNTIQAADLDVLVELAGHSGNNRLRVVACKPARKTITYLGYPNTTGLRSVDCRIVDNVTDPPTSDALCAEQLVRMPSCFLCYTPPPSPPAGLRCQLCLDGRLTGKTVFGSFNTLAKHSEATLALWARVLAAVPASVLVLKCKALQSASIAERFEKKFPGRLISMGMTANTETHLHCYSHIDIALDSFPYSGTTTSCEALVSGVPVVSLTGRAHAQNVTASLLAAVGYPEWAARTEDEYVAIARGLAGDRGRLKAWKEGGLRREVEGSALCDGERHTREIEAIYVS